MWYAEKKSIHYCYYHLTRLVANGDRDVAV